MTAFLDFSMAGKQENFRAAPDRHRRRRADIDAFDLNNTYIQRILPLDRQLACRWSRA
jgi:hypothetical protein